MQVMDQKVSLTRRRWTLVRTVSYRSVSVTWWRLWPIYVTYISQSFLSGFVISRRGRWTTPFRPHWLLSSLLFAIWQWLFHHSCGQILLNEAQDNSDPTDAHHAVTNGTKLQECKQVDVHARIVSFLSIFLYWLLKQGAKAFRVYTK